MQAMQHSLRKPFLWVLALLFLVGMHYFQQNLGSSGLQLPSNVMSWIFISALICLSLWQIALNKKIYYSKLSLKFGLVVLILCIPLFYQNADLGIFALPRLMGLFAGWLVFMGLMQFNFRKKHLYIVLYIVLAGILVQAVYGAVQYYLIGIWHIIPNQFLGYNPVSMRPHGIFQQPNVMASFMATGLALSLYMLYTNKWHRYFWWAKVLVYITPIFTSLLLMFNASRVGYIGAILILVLFLPYTIIKSKKALLYWVGCLCLGLAFSQISSKIPGNHVVGKNDIIGISSIVVSNGRPTLYLHSFYMIYKKPFLGWGYGSFETSYLNSISAPDSQIKNDLIGNADHPHNEFLYWTVEGGVIPLIALLYAVWLILGLVRHLSTAQSMAKLALLLPISLHTMTEYPFYQSSIHWLVFILILAFLDQSQNKTRTSISCHSSFLLKAMSILLISLSSIFMLSTLHTTNRLGKFEITEQFNEPNILNDIINPFAYRTRVDWNIMNARLRLPYKDIESRQAFLNEYILWLEKTSKHTPRREFYHNWLACLRELGKDKAAKQLRVQAKRLFPDFEDAKISQIKLKSTQPAGTMKE